MEEKMESKPDAFNIVIGIFSGRPNPEMSLDAEVAEKFTDLVCSALGEERFHAPSSPGLGNYYGFFVRAPERLAKRYSVPTEFRIFHGVITEERGKAQFHWRDVANIERFLIEMAFEKGFGELLEHVGVRKTE